MNKKIFLTVLVVFVVGLFYVATDKSKASFVGTTSNATLSLSPTSGTYTVNQNFTLSIYVNTRSQNVVVVAAYLNYDKNRFQAVSIDSADSVFTMQAENAIDSTNGVIKISRGKPTPGVNSASALVAKVIFKPIANASPTSDNFTFQFTPGSVLESNVILDNGLGTDILSGVDNGRYSATGGTDVSVSPTPSQTPFPTPGLPYSPTPTPSLTPTPSVTPPPGGWGPGNRPRPSQFGLREGMTVAATGSNDPDVYIVNDAGFKRLFLNPVIFGFYGHLGGFGWVTKISSTTRDAFETSGIFRNCEANDPKVYAVEVTGEDTGTLHWINMTGTQVVTENSEFFQKVFCINNNEFNWYTSNSSRFGSVFTSLSQIPIYRR